MRFGKIEKVILYNDSADEVLDIEEIAQYLREKLKKLLVEIRENTLAYQIEKYPDLAREFASIKIQDTNSRIVRKQEPLYGEVQYEKRRILGKTRAFGVLYDGFRLHQVYSELIPGEERSFSFIHILFTNRLFATWEEFDRRYHARTSVYGFPSIISTTGLVEAPARSRGYYLFKQQYEIMGKDLLELKERFKGSFINYEDKRLIEVMKGYVMQAVFYSLTGYPFCEDKGCRLYNAHWQEELIFAQLESQYEFCEHHIRILDNQGAINEC